MASGQSLFVGIALASAVLRMVVSGRMAGNGAVLIFFAVFLAAGILLIVYLCQSFTALRLYHSRAAGHAFQPIMPQGMPQGTPVLPYTEYSSAEPPPYPQTGTTPPTPRDQA